MEEENKKVQTYADDIAKVVQKNEPGIIKQIIEDQEKNEAFNSNYSPASKKNKLLISLGFLFIILAVVAVYIFFTFREQILTTIIGPKEQSLIFTDQNKSIEIGGLDKETIAQNVVTEINNTTIKVGEVESINLTENKNIIGFRRFISLIEGSLNTDQLKPIGDNFLIGIFNSGVPEVPKTATPPVDTIPKINPPVTSVVVEGVPVTLNSSAFFKTGTVDFIDVDAKDKAKKVISDFLDGVDFPTSSIQVIGTYSVERPSSKNNQIAEARRKVGVDILNEVLNEKYSAEDIAKIMIGSKAKGASISDIFTEEEIKAMTEEQLEKAIDSTQGIQYIAEAKTKSKIIPAPIMENTILPADATVEKNTKTLPVIVSGDLFILLKVTSFVDIFPVMRSWENKMLYDLHSLFGVELNPETKYLFNKDFKDSFISNKNGRVLYDNDGQVILMYVFVDDSNVVISNNEATLDEVLTRLSTSKKPK